MEHPLLCHRSPPCSEVTRPCLYVALPADSSWRARRPDATLEGAVEKNALLLKMLSWKVTGWD